MGVGAVSESTTLRFWHRRDYGVISATFAECAACGWVGTASTDATVGVLALGSLRSELVRVGAFLPPS